MHSYSMDLGGRTLTIEAGKIAKQANGAVLVRYGDTAVVVAVTGTKTPREGVDFFPLTVDFEEKMYAVGKIPGGFIKREGRPSEQAILTSRLIDRPIRPMFPEGYHNDVQIVATAVSVDPDNAPDMPAMIGASCALSISDIPFEGPIAGVRVGLIDGEFIITSTPEPFFGKAMISRMLFSPINSINMRSTPYANPACGGAPNLKAPSIAPNFSSTYSREKPSTPKTS